MSNFRRVHCLMIRDLIRVMQLIESELMVKMTEEKPKFILVGSIVEGTRTFAATELDITVQFLGLGPFTLGEDAFTLKLDGNGKYRYELFFGCFLSTLAGVIEDKREEIVHLTQGRIKVPNAKGEVPQKKMQKLDHICPFLKNDKAKGNFYTHCENCLLFPVTQTKGGACLIFKWQSQEILTIDLIPVLPIKGKSLQELMKSVTKTLFEQKPPNWLNYMRGFIKQDRIMPESYNENPADVYVGMKLINYGSEKNFLIRPAQQLEIHQFEKQDEMKKAYRYIKCLKKILKVDLSSYFIKKVLLSNTMRRKLMDDLMPKNVYTALQHPDLKVIFEKVIDYDQWDVDNYWTITLKESFFFLTQH